MFIICPQNTQNKQKCLADVGHDAEDCGRDMACRVADNQEGLRLLGGCHRFARGKGSHAEASREAKNLMRKLIVMGKIIAKKEN